jgi:hypothetical protein
LALEPPASAPRLVERAIAIPLVNPKEVAFVSKRVVNFQRHPVLGTLISQLWVR